MTILLWQAVYTENAACTYKNVLRHQFIDHEYDHSTIYRFLQETVDNSSLNFFRAVYVKKTVQARIQKMPFRRPMSSE